jgi:pilus assembly protein CpaF
MPRHALHSQLAAAVHVVLHMVRCSDLSGVRRLAAVGVLERDGDLVRVLPAWEDGRWGPGEQRLQGLLGSQRFDGHSAGAAC